MFQKIFNRYLFKNRRDQPIHTHKKSFQKFVKLI